mmetsp:Transcript_103652/g.178983  ORF Transcript_103652/g.178983 Transcript_103652/m.178983 type:complete len:95 (+) Transcript_103652:558-842(+)
MLSWILQEGVSYLSSKAATMSLPSNMVSEHAFLLSWVPMLLHLRILACQAHLPSDALTKLLPHSLLFGQIYNQKMLLVMVIVETNKSETPVYSG